MFGFIKKYVKNKKETGNEQKIIMPYKKRKYKNCLVIGSTGTTGKVTHPWDYLRECTCGSKPWIIYNDKEPFYCGGDTSNVYILCPKCGKHTDHANIEAVFDMWDKLICSENENINFEVTDDMLDR